MQCPYDECRRGHTQQAEVGAAHSASAGIDTGADKDTRHRRVHKAGVIVVEVGVAVVTRVEGDGMLEGVSGEAHVKVMAGAAVTVGVATMVGTVEEEARLVRQGVPEGLV